MPSLTYENGSLVLNIKYNPLLVGEIKKLPAAERKWDVNRKMWLIDPRHGQQIVNWAAQYCGTRLQTPPIPNQPAVSLEMMEVRYIGACKERTPGEFTAYGWVSGEWSVIFSEDVLREWFEGKPRQPNGHVNATTLYGILGVAQTANAEELKKAYRRMARQWHPDVCSEPDATERFKRINEAYQVLSDSNQRSRYDVGLALEASLNQPNAWKPTPSFAGYRTPLLCGMILAEGHHRLGRFVVDKIILWEDIHNNAGNVLVVSWPAGADIFQEKWV